jgi:imidazole glycerol phosphate synthase subunit HisF
MAESLPRKNICPLLDKPCLGLDCKWYLQLTGTDPQDASKTIDGWDCAIVWQVQAQLDVRKAVTGGLDGVQKATESFRNVNAQANLAAMKVAVNAMSRPRLINYDAAGDD